MSQSPHDGADAPRRPVGRTPDALGATDLRHRRRPSPEVYRRRRLVVGLAALLAVVLVVVFLAVVWPGFARPAAEEEPAPTVTVTEPPQTPTIDPVERTLDAQFAQALPSEVLRFALRSEGETEALDGWDPLEAYELVYADAAGDDATRVTVVAGQWSTDAEARTVAEALVAEAGTPTSTGDVLVDGETAGTYAVTPAEDGTATVTWYNGTAVVQATGPVEDIEDFYTVFPI
ncbi:hypothetical protein [Oerskovia flava]|uniref:hypothetical protein n=1 Tax=Oerskovia flava TaxID=2986422 RepID=UPI00223F9638|nr:hypothetical protein [Oerskovia sp. JB1-3-2]